MLMALVVAVGPVAGACSATEMVAPKPPIEAKQRIN